MNLKKLMSLMLAFVMMLAVVAPTAQVFAAGVEVKASEVVGTITKDDVQNTKPDKTSLTVHKLVAEKYNKGVPVDHNGGTLSTEQLGKLGTNVKELDGVTFTYFKVEGPKHFQKMLDNKNDYKTVDAVKNFLSSKVDDENAQGNKDSITSNTITTAEGKGAKVDLDEGNYWFVESDRPSRVTEAKAVPFGITLPLTNQIEVNGNKPGTVYMKNVHVYPKNVEQKPQMDKGFRNDNTNLDSKTLKEWQEKYGPTVDQYQREKDKIDARVGSKVPYEVKTSLKQGQIYKTLSWSDMMTKGLKYNNDVKIYYKAANNEIEIQNAEIKQNPGVGFDIIVKEEETIKAINKALESGDVEIILRYSATVTIDTVVDKPENNNITFTPGEPNHNNNFTQPGKTELIVNKTWAEGEPGQNKPLVTYMLIQADDTNGTNKKVVASVSTKGDGKLLAESYTGKISATAEGYKVTFKNLDNTKAYTVEEFADGYDPTYNGAETIENKINPDRVTPTPPQVVTGGKKFVKTDEKDNRLAGAEFKVTNEDGSKYLVAKTEAKIAMAQEKVTQAKAALDKLIEEYNKLSADAQKTSNLKETIKTQQEAYNKAVKEAGNIYEWGKENDAMIFISNADGQFEVTGLAYGKYKLVEVKAPKGFAKLNTPITFTVDKDSYSNFKSGIDFTPDSKAKDAQKIENKNLTIPQTGGIGTVIFTVVGAALMGGAIYMMKRNKEEEAN
ncbi:pilin N-terminal domain-containing protein [Peptoniphilus asaccharolyticus]